METQKYYILIMQKVFRKIPIKYYASNYQETLDEIINLHLDEFQKNCLIQITTVPVQRCDFESIGEFDTAKSSFKTVVEMIQSSPSSIELISQKYRKFSKCEHNDFLFHYNETYLDMQSVLTECKTKRDDLLKQLDSLDNEIKMITKQIGIDSKRYSKEYNELYLNYMDNIPTVSVYALELSNELREYLTTGLRLYTLRDVVRSGKAYIYDTKFRSELDEFFDTYVGIPVNYRL